jgi:cytidylate kinase
MQTQPGFEKCLHFINSQAQHIPAPASSDKRHRPPLAITISRQTGSGAYCVAVWLARFLQDKRPEGSYPWTVFDRDIVERVLKDHNLPARLARFMPEDRIPEITDTLDELLGVHPPAYTLVQQTAETILQLANRGSAILIGRAAHVITSKLDHVFHVRLVGSLEKRIEHIREIRGIGKSEALALIRQEDRGRQRYLKKYFGKDIDDPLSYHLVVNTDSGPYERAARLIGDAALDYLHVRQGPAVARAQQRYRVGINQLL